MRKRKRLLGFTIVELLVSRVVIGILSGLGGVKYEEVCKGMQK